MASADVWDCPFCGEEITTPLARRCPHCGERFAEDGAAMQRGVPEDGTYKGEATGPDMTTFFRAYVQSAELRGAYLSEADLFHADLSAADLRGADLGGANLNSADLSRADLSRANLVGADLSDADLRGTDLRGDLIGTILADAQYDEYTAWPEGFDPLAAGAVCRP